MVLIITDVALSFDNIMSIAVVSNNIFVIFTGMFFSILLPMALLPWSQMYFPA
ncbi:hypothetical protein [Ferviditalea candida]|uniref:hypothetical protein n=1 Tax=Ferviditalea candida TaxID=3108399 RepID=UPI00352CF210